MIEARRVDFVAQPVSDLSRADAFYGETLGLPRNPKSSGDRWVEYETGNLTLALSTFGGAIAVGVDDVDSAKATLAEAGVEFHGETFDSGVCNGAPFSDPDGNRLLLHHRYAPLEHWQPPAGEFERTDYIGVATTDGAGGVGFYGERLGLRRNELASDEWPEFEPGNATLLLQTGFTPGKHPIALRVANVGASLERLRAAGVEFAGDQVHDSGVCQAAFFEDPDGNPLVLHRRYAPYADGTMA